MSDAAGRVDAPTRDRACGLLIATAAGDALGAPYEFGPPLDPGVPVTMTGGGSLGRSAGEWTDDTAMTIAIAEVAATGVDLRSVEAQDRIVARWAGWARTAKDVGDQTRHVLSRVTDGPGAAASARRAATELHDRTGHTGGNGSLMRTAPVVLTCLDDAERLAETAAAIGALTHVDADAADACVLWCAAMRHAVLTGEIDIHVGMELVPADRREPWMQRIVVAEDSAPGDFAHNGWVVEAFQGAWSAIATTSTDGPGHLPAGLEAAVRGGRDADTVAAIAGGLLGAAYGASAVPDEWRDVLNGWPGLRADDLLHLAATIVERAPSA